MGREDQGITNSRHRWHVIPRVLCFVLHEDEVLLLRGAPTKRIWPNRLNGVGGHVERDEDLRHAALREIDEETGLQVTDLTLAGIVNIDSGADAGILMAVWTARSSSRLVRQTQDGTLEWFSIAALPTADLVDDLAVLLPKVLERQPGAAPFFGHYTYDEHNRLVMRWSDAQ